ncbi:M16 family metallopeptidase [Patescibacteria group bacterium]
MSEEPIIKTLENGLRVVYVPFKGSDSVSFRLIGRAGSMWESPEELGIAHYIEHLLFDGTKKYPTTEKLTSLIENGGGYLNAYTGTNAVGYVVKTLKSELEISFDYLSQLSMYPLFEEKEIEKERTIIVQEYKRQLNNPVSNFRLNTHKHIYANGSRLQQPILGTHETLKTINREQILNYYESNYGANNFVLSICGDGVEEEVFQLANKYFNTMNAGALNDYTKDHYIDEHSIYTEVNKEVKQATVSVLYQAPEDYADGFYSTKHLRKIMGGSMLSRLAKEIREKRGLAYVVSARYNAAVDFGTLEHMAQVEPKNVEEVIKVIRDEINKIAKEGITQEEFDRAQKSLNSAFVFNNEVPEKRADIQGNFVLEGHKDETYESHLQKIMAVTLEEVNEVAKEIYSHHPKFSVLSNNITDEQVLNAWNS